MNINTYLERINFTGYIKPDVQTLNGLQLAHLRSVPFENLDIGLKRPIHLSEDALWEKIITRRRGGFCYELNGMFAWLLKQVGFDVTYLNARVFNHEGDPGIDFDHLALLVRTPNQSIGWLADVGFGDSFDQPLILEENGEQTQGLRAYRLDKASSGFIVWQKNYEGTWEREYFFDLLPHDFPSEYEPACLFHQTSPKSSFTQGSIISMATIDGRVSLEEGRLIITKQGERTERLLENKDEYFGLLKEYFGVKL